MRRDYFKMIENISSLLGSYGLEIEDLGVYDNIIHEFELEIFELKKLDGTHYDYFEIKAIRKARPIYKEYLEIIYDESFERHNIKPEDKTKTKEREEFLAKFNITPQEASKVLQISKSKLFEDGYASLRKKNNQAFEEDSK